MVGVGARAVRAGAGGGGADRPGALAVIRYCLDTSAYGHFKRGEPGVTALLDRADWIGVPAVVIGELFVGFLAGGRRSRNEEELAAFLAHPAVEEVPVDREVAQVYADIVTALRQAGTPLPTNDVWIAAAAARTGAPVLTFDEHFEAIGRVGTVLLPSGLDRGVSRPFT